MSKEQDASVARGGNARRPTVLVTGAAGTLARQVIRGLKADHEVVAVDFRYAARLGPRVPSYKVDVTKRGFEDVFRKHDIDGIVHLGRIGEDSSRESRYNANVLGSRRMFDLALNYGVKKVVVLSTFYVYGADAYNPALLDEASPLKASNLTMDLVDSVELENLANIYLWRYPELDMTILRPCHIAGPGVRNTMSLLLSQPMAPFLVGFSPMMQFLHVDDMARAVEMSFRHRGRGIYNVAPEDWLPYQDVMRECGCLGLPVPSLPPNVPATLSRLMRWKAFPSFLVDYFKYPVVIDGSLFRKTFGFQPEHSMADVFEHYRHKKKR
ncbi:MAG: SDR family oxidoreductase [Pseudomonadota bacterium]